jgi:hypothetical protein
MSLVTATERHPGHCPAVPGQTRAIANVDRPPRRAVAKAQAARMAPSGNDARVSRGDHHHVDLANATAGRGQADVYAKSGPGMAADVGRCPIGETIERRVADLDALMPAPVTSYQAFKSLVRPSCPSIPLMKGGWAWRPGPWPTCGPFTFVARLKRPHRSQKTVRDVLDGWGSIHPGIGGQAAGRAPWARPRWRPPTRAAAADSWSTSTAVSGPGQAGGGCPPPVHRPERMRACMVCLAQGVS